MQHFLGVNYKRKETTAPSDYEQLKILVEVAGLLQKESGFADGGRGQTIVIEHLGGSEWTCHYDEPEQHEIQPDGMVEMSDHYGMVMLDRDSDALLLAQLIVTQIVRSYETTEREG